LFTWLSLARYGTPVPQPCPIWVVGQGLHVLVN